MIIFPAIDLKEGVCVRLMQGDPDRVTVYGNDPVAVAARWAQEGAQWLHIVDLDGAFSSSPKNRQSVQSILKNISVPVQVGGGIRDRETAAAYLNSGVERVIVGTVALRNPRLLERLCEEFPHRVALGIDARDGRVAIEGWKETTETTVSTLVEQFSQMPLAAIIHTDIHRDGMQSGVNLKATQQLLESTHIPVIASGGVSTLEDIKALLPLASMGLEGVITGRAIYNGTLVLSEAISFVRENLR